MEQEEKQAIRDDLAAFYERRTYLEDEHRSEAVAKRHAKKFRTARENIADLCDADSFLEMGSLIVAGQGGRKSEEELRQQTPADGLIAGIGTINGDQFGAENAKCFVLSYDYTVLAGTQGGFNHKKTDRVIQQATAAQKPIVFFVEGGGGRPGDVDFDPITIGGLDLNTWASFAQLSGKVPRIAIVNGYCFAGNAAIAGCSDVIIATKNSSLGLGGPAMIEGGGLGRFHPRDIGPSEVHSKNGVIDILVEDETAAVKVARQYLAFFQGNTEDWSTPDQSLLRDMVPENRKFAYNIHKIIHQLCDENSVLELRAGFARNMVTALGRVEGKSIGLIANSTRHLGGAIDSDAADKVSRFQQLCDAFGIPILSLCDAPGFMVGPEHEKLALVRHTARMFLTGANIQVPILTVVLRKAYGLGAMAMAGGSLHRSFCTVAWPTAEFGAMGLEGAVKLGFRKELEACPDEESRVTLYEKLLKQAYRRGQAINAASKLEFDEVIDPKDTRKWILQMLETCSYSASHRFIDSW